MASEVTSSIDHRHTDPMFICLKSHSVFQCLLLDPVVDRYDIVDFLAKTLELPILRCWLNAKHCSGGRCYF